MLSLLLNENMKIYRRLRSWLLLLGLIVITTVTLLFVQNHVRSSQTSTDWKVNVQHQIDNDNRRLQSQGVPDERKAELQADLKVNQYRLDHQIPPTEHTLWGNVLTAANLIALVTIFTVIAAADSVAGEFSAGTVKLLLIRPKTRSSILLSKYISTLLFSLLLFVTLFATAFVVSGLLQGYNDMGTPYVYASTQDGLVHTTNMVHHVLSTYGYHCIELIMIVTMAFMISTVFRSSSLAIGMSIGIMFIGSSIADFLTQYAWAKYYLFENTDLTPYLTDSPKIAGMTLSFSVTVLIVYFVLFMGASWLVFNRRDVAA